MYVTHLRIFLFRALCKLVSEQMFFLYNFFCSQGRISYVMSSFRGSAALTLPGFLPPCRPAGTDFTIRLHREIKFRPGKARQFSTWYLFKFVYIFSLIFLCKHMLINFSTPIRRAEAIAWETFIPAKRASGSTNKGFCLSMMKLSTYNQKMEL